jgi:PAS domain S-box-containing protein
LIKYPVPINEHERLEELYRYDILDTPAEDFFDNLTCMAAQACGTPIALVSLVDRDRQWFKSHHGLDALETPREQAFCAHTVLGNEPVIVTDASLDARFADNALVRGPPHIRFYAAVPLITPRGFVLGSLCVIDRRPRTLTDSQLITLRLLAGQVTQQLELRRVADTLRRQSVLLDKVQQTAQIGGWEVDLRTRELTWSDETYRIHGLTPADYHPEVDTAISFYTPETAPLIRQAVEAAISAGVRFDLELQIVRRDGERRWVRAIGRREDEAGEPRRVFGVFQDVTERRQLEGELVLIAQREQTRISFDLHDGLGQELTGITLLLNGLMTQVPDSETAFRDDLRRVALMVRSALETCRSLAKGLSPTGREPGGLCGAIRQLGARMAHVSGVKVRVRIRGQMLPLAEAVADHLFRITQEAITNALKHGHCKRILVSLDCNASRAWLSIRNDGIPITAAVVGEGMGLKIMRHRAHLIGATLTIGETTGGETRVSLSLPAAPPRTHPDYVFSESHPAHR